MPAGVLLFPSMGADGTTAKAKAALAKKGKAGWKAVKGMKKAPGAAGEGDAAGEAKIYSRTSMQHVDG